MVLFVLLFKDTYIDVYLFSINEKDRLRDIRIFVVTVYIEPWFKVGM